MPFEKPQKGNPHQLTVNQHIHTAHAIGKFEGADGCVEVKRVATGEIRRVHPRDGIFCARRAWDERAEKGYMHGIEDAFHAELRRAQTGGSGSRDRKAISQYHLLWALRHAYATAALHDTVLVGVSGSNLTREQEETVEAKWGGFVRAGGNVPARFDASFQIQRGIDMNIAEYEGHTWGLLHASAGEFLVADCYDGRMILPITPTLCFYGDEPDRAIGREDVALVNRATVAAATNFYFAREIAACPV